MAVTLCERGNRPVGMGGLDAAGEGEARDGLAEDAAEPDRVEPSPVDALDHAVEVGRHGAVTKVEEGLPDAFGQPAALGEEIEVGLGAGDARRPGAVRVEPGGEEPLPDQDRQVALRDPGVEDGVDPVEEVEVPVEVLDLEAPPGDDRLEEADLDRGRVDTGPRHVDEQEGGHGAPIPRPAAPAAVRSRLVTAGRR